MLGLYLSYLRKTSELDQICSFYIYIKAAEFKISIVQIVLWQIQKTHKEYIIKQYTIYYLTDYDVTQSVEHGTHKPEI